MKQPDPQRISDAVNGTVAVSVKYTQAMLTAQAMESDLVMVVLLLKGENGDLATHDAFWWTLEQLERRTGLRELVREIRALGVPIRRDTDRRVIDGIRARNFLAHRFFIEYSGVVPFPTPAITSRALARLAKLTSAIEEANTLLDPLMNRLSAKIGVDRQEAMKRYAREIEQRMSLPEAKA